MFRKSATCSWRRRTRTQNPSPDDRRLSLPWSFGALAVVCLHHAVASGTDGFLQPGAGPGHQRDFAVAVTRERDFAHTQSDLPGGARRVSLEANVSDLVPQAIGDPASVAAGRL